MQFRIPPQLKETVTVVRQDAFDRNKEITVAENVVCLIAPETDLIRVAGGVAVGGADWGALLEKPNTDIASGDILRRSDDSELTVHRVRPLDGTMKLELKGDEIP
ncbi:MAG: S24/S26 family peptidase [Candidatus Poribacteria bacterium]|nr:S24/S26 family peptidase [Candidatus Poribacteria bacterium]